MLNFMRPTREIVLARVEGHALEQLGGGIHGGRIAGTELAVGFVARALVLAASLRMVAAITEPTSCAFRKNSIPVMPASISYQAMAWLAAARHDYFGGHIDYVGDDRRTFEIVVGDFHLFDLRRVSLQGSR